MQERELALKQCTMHNMNKPTKEPPEVMWETPAAKKTKWPDKKMNTMNWKLYVERK
jgi:hypothetical protein